jgi:hypothetical protein
MSGGIALRRIDANAYTLLCGANSYSIVPSPPLDGLPGPDACTIGPASIKAATLTVFALIPAKKGALIIMQGTPENAKRTEMQ